MENNELVKLNLGCGNNILAGYINIDKIRLEGVDLVLDLEEHTLPLADNSVSEVICDHILEHINNFIPLMEELYRVCANKAVIHVFVPNFKYEAAFRDPTHVRFFTEHTFDYFSADNMYNYYTTARFKVLSTKFTRIHKIKRFRKSSILAILPFKKIFNYFLFNIFTEIVFKLEVVK